MPIYFAEIGGVPAAVDPNSTVEVGIVREAAKGRRRPRIEWIGRRTFREVAGDFSGVTLVTAWAVQIEEGGARRPLGQIVSLKCTIDDSLDRPEENISPDEARLIVQALEASGRSDLAARAAPILERITRTDPPPRRDSETMRSAKPS